MKQSKLLTSSVIGSCLWVASALAGTIEPEFGSFGSLSAATFGGSGIPNNAVAVTTFESGKYTFTLGLTATGRYSNPNPANDGAGTFYAISGGDTFSGSNANSNYARWNVGYYVDVNPDLKASWGQSPYKVELFFDKNPSVGNDVTTKLTLEPSLLSPNFDSQNSWNLGMMLTFGFGAFNPSATGEYGFALVVSKDNQELGRSAILVNVNETGTAPTPAPVPEGGATAALVGLALAGFGLAARRRSA